MKSYLLLISLLFYFFIHRLQAQNGFFVTSADKTAIYVEEMGAGDPIVFLAGGPGLEPDYLLPLMKQLAATHRCLLLHQRGTGRTQLDSLTRQTLALSSYVADIEAVRQHIKAQQITVAGHSWGGMLSQVYTGNHPRQVKRLLLLDSGGPSLRFTVFYNDNILMRLQETDLQALETAQRQGNVPQLIQALTPGYFYNRSRGLAFQQTATPANPQVGRINELLLNQYGQLGSQVATQLARYKGPVCVIQGRQDPIGESTAYEIKGVLPQAELHFIERSGHFPWLETEPAVQAFFQRLNQCTP